MKRWIWILAILLPACDLTGPEVTEPRGRYELTDFLLVSNGDTLKHSDFSEYSYLYLDFVDDRTVSGEGYIEVMEAGQVVGWLFYGFDGTGIGPQPVRGEYILVGDQLDFDLWAGGRDPWIGGFTWTLSREDRRFSVEESSRGRQLRIVFEK